LIISEDNWRWRRIIFINFNFVVFMKNRRRKGYLWESIVKRYFLNKWYKFISSNFTIRWWEIDLIFERDDVIYFIEVKMVDTIDDYCDYITRRKLSSLVKTINTFLFKNHKYDWYYKKLLFVFVKDNNVDSIFEYYI